MARDKKNRNGRCALCLETRTLCDSHIISELWYVGLYNEDRYMNEVSVDETKHPKRVRKGYHEYLLCRPCEEIVHTYEEEAKRLRDGTGLVGVDITDRLSMIAGLDYTLFKLFQLSVLWRMAVSTNELFAAVKLGPHEETLRRMVLEGNPGQVGDYGCFIGCHTYKGRHATNWLIPPARIEDFVVPRTGLKFARYIVIFGGYSWQFWIVTDDKLDADMKSILLQKDGSFKTTVDDILAKEGVRNALVTMRENRARQPEQKKNKRLDSGRQSG